MASLGGELYFYSFLDHDADWTVAVPVFTWLTSWILRMGNIPYVSYTNAIEIITGSPWVALGLLAELLALVVVIYWQFAFILLSIVNIRQEKPRTLWAVLRKTILSLQGTSPVTFLFFLGYFIIIVPFGGLLLSSPLLNKVKIPDFIWQFLLQNPVATVAIVTFYVLVGYLGIRLLLTLPLMIIQQVRTVPAIRLSWRKTHGRVWFYIGNIVLIVGTKALITMLVYLLAYFSQLYLDTTKLAFAGAMVNLFLMELISEFMNYYMSTLVFGLMISGGANDFRQLRAASLLQFSRPKVRHWQRWVTGTALVFLTASMVAFNAVVLNGHALSKPMAISHRE
ncbi:glycerophosphoryl diester phosphodiesterase membrane domain-containing protein [Lentilactobacillus senioris]|uniref:glycerophosphoryl diester phosphodiesterase membrane domain-containing protein n=1 Tax=Lentilactobacillus senioris TaxID=931534 RepID=UPI0020936F62|nr:glycerophosphoryl diester phosphodiesterase membrane domain-containing protein [Lentilactobacillus senioris]